MRINSFMLKSHSDDRSQVIDRFEYHPNPGGIMLPRSGNDLVLDRILLKANGSRRRWSYRWSASWSYTFWRPIAAGLPMSASAEMPAGLAGAAEPIIGGDAGAMADESGGAPDLATLPPTGDLVEIRPRYPVDHDHRPLRPRADDPGRKARPGSCGRSLVVVAGPPCVAVAVG